MTTRRDFFAAAATVAATGVYPDLAPVFARAARHRQVFGVRRVHDGSALGQMKNSLNAYEFARAEGPGSMHIIAVLYGTAVALALDDHIWRAYRIAELLTLEGDPVVRASIASGNPFLRAPQALPPENAGAVRSAAPDASLSGLMRRGVSTLVCDNALTELALGLTTIVGPAHGSVDSTLRSFHAHLVPGTTLVPAGVAALNDAQEARYTYVAT